MSLTLSSTKYIVRLRLGAFITFEFECHEASGEAAIAEARRKLKKFKFKHNYEDVIWPEGNVVGVEEVKG